MTPVTEAELTAAIYRTVDTLAKLRMRATAVGYHNMRDTKDIAIHLIEIASEFNCLAIEMTIAHFTQTDDPQ